MTDPILAGLVEQLYGVEVPPAPSADLVSIFLTGIEGVNQPATVQPAEMLRLNISVAPTPFGEQDRLGLLAAQPDGFPNGRRVGDDVADIALRAVAGGTPFTPELNVAPNNALFDGAHHARRPAQPCAHHPSPRWEPTPGHRLGPTLTSFLAATVTIASVLGARKLVRSRSES